MAAALFLFLVAAADSVSAQSLSNCVTVICPPPVVTNYTCENFYVPQQYPIIVTNRCTNVQVQANCNPPPGTPLPLGANSIHCTFTASVPGGAQQVVADCSFTIFVIQDTIPPVIQCPTNIVVGTCPGAAGCGAMVLYPPPSASDNSGSVSVTCTPPSGSLFPCGTNNVTCIAEDRCQLKSACSFTVVVVPTGNPPVIQCPPDITVDTCSNSATVVFSPTVTPAGTFVVCNPPSGSSFPIGFWNVNCIASNGCGTAECNFKVTVRNAQATIQCPTNIFVTSPCGSNCTFVSYPSPIVNNGTFIGCAPPSGSCFAIGATTVICRATNKCGIVQCQFDVNVQPGTAQVPPNIQCPTNIVRTLPCNSNCVPVFYPPPTVSNGFLFACNPPSGTCLPAGTHVVNCFATNSCSSADCTFTIQVNPGGGSTQPVTIQCPTNIVVTAPCNSNCVPVFYPAPIVNNGVFLGCTFPSGSCFPIGITTVTCFATNNCGGSASCQFDVRVVAGQGTQPTIQCPTNIFRTSLCGSNCAIVTYPNPIVGNGIFAGCLPPSGTCFAVGTTVVTCHASNNCGTVQCQFNVAVQPGTNQNPPTIKCPTNIVRTLPCNSNCLTVTYPPPTVTNGFLVFCNPPSGSCLPAGTTVVNCFATNTCGSVQCSFTIQVNPSSNQQPTIQCPTNIVVTAPCNTNCIPVNYPLPVVGNGVLLNCTPPPGFCFPVGITTVICRATNNCGGSAQCSFEVRVLSGQGQPPVIQCPTTNVIRTLPCGSNCVSVFYPLPPVSNGTLVGCNPPQGTCLPLGVHPITCSATNSCGLSAQCTFNVEVRPTTAQPPTIRCPTNDIILTVGCSSNCVAISYPPPFVTNGVFLGCNPPQGTCLPVGVYNVICRASNACATVECEFLLRVVSNGEPPRINCPTNPIVNTVPCGAICVPISYPIPTVTNGAVSGCTPPPGTCLSVGVYVVTCTATNSCGETKCDFTLEVRPGQGVPTIQCPTNRTFFLPCNSNCVTITYPPPTVVNGVFIGCTPPSGSCLPLGVYTVTCVATNGCGQTKCDFTINVIPLDPKPPSIQCPTNILVTAPCGSNCVPVFYPNPIVGNGTLLGCNPPSGSCFPIGLTTVNCRATNSCGGVADCKFDVRVVSGQGQAPGLRCPTNFTVLLPCGSNCVPVPYPLPVVTNGVFVGCTPAPGTCLPAGNHVVTCFATNDCGSASCEFVISVIGQSAPPTIQCPTNLLFTLPCGSNCVPVFYPNPIVSNGVLESCTPPSGTCLPVGIYNVNCRATNSCGQSALCSFQIRVIQGTGQTPVIQCTSNIVVTAPCGSNCVPVFYPTPFVTNGVLESCIPPPGTCFPVGTNFVTCRATNNCGASTCTFRVLVIRGTGQGPTIKCPTNFVVATVPCGSNCVPVFYPLPTVTNGVLVGCSPPSGTCLPIGNHPVLCTASNACGQVECGFTVQVVGGTGHPPIITCPTNISVETCSPNCTPVPYPLPTVANGSLVGCNPPPTFCFPLGTTTVTCVATNSCGTNSCTFTVTVRPVPFPVIQCPSNIVLVTCGTGEFVNYPPPIILGNPTNVTVTCTPPSGSFFPLGTNVVRCCAVDRCNRTNCCEFQIIIRPKGNPCVAPPPGMVLWLPLDEPVGPIAANIIPGAPNGFHGGGPVPLLGQYVLNSLRFDGINDFVRVPNYAAIMLNASDLSIDAWILREQPDQGRRVIVSKIGALGGSSNVRGYEYYLNNGVMNLLLAGVVAQNFNSGVPVPADNNWHHVAVVVQRSGSGAVQFYLDGGLVNVQPGPIPLPLGNNSSLHVGAGTFPAPNNFFHGPIDEVEIFKRALTPAEVFALWNAHQSGKCKITCATPMVTPVTPGTCVTVNVQVCNNNALPQTISWVAQGAAIATPQSGTFVLPPFTCTNVPVTLCSPAGTPPNSSLPWTFSVSSDAQCPMVCTGVVVNPGIIVIGPNDPTGITGTNQTSTVRLSLNGLPPGSPVRFRAIGPDMEPDQYYLSLNGLPPGVPWELSGVSLAGGKGGSKASEGLDVPIRFADADPGGHYTILLEADLDGDGEYEPLSSFAAQNSVVSPPTIRIVDGQLWWDDMGDGLGNLECADSLDGPWSPIPGGPGTPIGTGGSMKFYRVAVPITE